MCCSDNSLCVVQTADHVLFRQFTVCCSDSSPCVSSSPCVVQTVHHALWCCSDISPRVVQTVPHVLFRQFPTSCSDSSPRLVQTVHHVLFRQFPTRYSTVPHALFRQVHHVLFRKFTTCCSLHCVLSSSGYNDELAWAAAWLYRVTGDKRYLQHAEENYVSTECWAVSWDAKDCLAAVRSIYKYKNKQQNRLWRHYCPSSSSHNETCNGRRGKGFKSCCCCIYC